jgi:seryl-tRNA(Sec) selenium transferase
MVYNHKEYQKQYREKNKEKQKEYNKEYYQNNKEKINEQKREYQKEYKEKNKERIQERDKTYWKTEAGKKASRINAWKRIGVKSDDYNSLYEYYLNCKNCEECNVELVEGRYGNNKKCLDHDHNTGQFRNVLCISCNTRRG